MGFGLGKALGTVGGGLAGLVLTGGNPMGALGGASLGGSLGGSLFGGGGTGGGGGMSKADMKRMGKFQVTAAQRALDTGAHWRDLTKPLEESVLQRLTDFMTGHLDPTASAMYAPGKLAAEQAYGTARNQVLADTPAGGALSGALAGVAGQRADSLTDLIAAIMEDEYNKAYSIGTTAPQTYVNLNTGTVGPSNAASQLSTAGSNMVSAMANQAQAGAGNLQSITGLVDLIAKLYAGGGTPGAIR